MWPSRQQHQRYRYASDWVRRAKENPATVHQPTLLLTLPPTFPLVLFHSRLPFNLPAIQWNPPITITISAPIKHCISIIILLRNPRQKRKPQKPKVYSYPNKESQKKPYPNSQILLLPLRLNNGNLQYPQEKTTDQDYRRGAMSSLGDGWTNRRVLRRGSVGDRKSVV